jgi:hypothetical protein
MQILVRPLLVLATVSLLVGATSALAQDQSAAASVARGQLVRVDSNARMLIIQGAQGRMTFRYTDQTKVSGAQEGVAGLATMTGAQLTVRYVKEQQDNIATEIEVQSTAQSQRSQQ